MELNKIIQHNALKPFPLPDNCIDVVMTSPPYWGLRDYGVDGQIGLEDHPSKYIANLVQVANEVKRVLKKSGSFYLNLGDTYFGSCQGYGQKPGQGSGIQNASDGYFASSKQKPPMSNPKIKSNWLQPKQLMLIPMRVAIALQDEGWILRNDIIWHKPNPMPSSVKDRLNNTFEHVFHFVKSRKYYYDLDKIREPHKTESIERYKHPMDGCFTPGKAYPNEKRDKPQNWNLSEGGKNPGDVIKGGAVLNEQGVIKVPGGKGWTKKIPGGGAACEKDPRWCPPEGKNPGDVLVTKRVNKRKDKCVRPDGLERPPPNCNHPDGKNPGDFWDICIQPFSSYREDLEHFAVFPEALVEKPLKSSCPTQVCKKCGKPRTRIIKTDNPSKEQFDNDALVEVNKIQKTSNPQSIKSLHRNSSPNGKTKGVYYSGKTVGWSDCGCNAGFNGGVVLDPFGGRGTVGRVAKQLGMNYIIFDLNPKYVELSQLYINGQKRKLISGQKKL